MEVDTETIPYLLYTSLERMGADEVVQWYEGDILQSMSWADSVEVVRTLARALIAHGVQVGDRVAIIGETSRHWAACDLAILSVGAVTLGIYPTSTREEAEWIVSDAEARLAFVDSTEWGRALMHTPGDLDDVVLMPQGAMDNGECEGLVTWDHFIGRGADNASPSTDTLEARWQAVTRNDLATLVYTSGTTGKPKGVELTHANLVHNARLGGQLLPLGPGDVSLVYLPLAHVLQRVALYAGLVAGGRAVYAEELTRLPEYLKEVRPTLLAGVPRVYEKIHAKVLSRVAGAPAPIKRLFDWALDVGDRYASCLRYRRPVPLMLRAQHHAADRLVLSKIRAGLGGRIRYMVSGAAPIAMETLSFFHACGIVIFEGYGLTETAAPVTLNTPEAFRFGTVGRAVPSAALKVAEDGEILVRGPMVFRGYWRRPDADEEAFIEDSEGVRWFRTGDIGELDSSNFLRITDRKKNIIITAGGKNIAPQPIENALRQEPLVEHVCVVGDRRPFLIALFCVDSDVLVDWAASRPALGAAVKPSGFRSHPEVHTYLQAHVTAVNEGLPRYATIKRFAVLPGSFDVESGTLTPTMKLRRSAIEVEYAAEIEALYGGLE